MNSEIGWVYMMRNSAMPGLVKIGFTMDDPWERANQLSSPTSVPSPFEVIYSIKTRFALDVEAEAHRSLGCFRHSSNREFFQSDLKTILFLDPRDGKEYWHTEKDILEYFILKIREAARLVPLKKQIKAIEQGYRRAEIKCGYLESQLHWKQCLEAGAPPP